MMMSDSPRSALVVDWKFGTWVLAAVTVNVPYWAAAVPVVTPVTVVLATVVISVTCEKKYSNKLNMKALIEKSRKESNKCQHSLLKGTHRKLKETQGNLMELKGTQRKSRELNQALVEVMGGKNSGKGAKGWNFTNVKEEEKRKQRSALQALNNWPLKVSKLKMWTKWKL